MEDSKLKNMVVLKNLPSNLVEEAFVILKSNKNAKKLVKIEEHNKIDSTPKSRTEKDYVLKEAEMLVSEYLSKIENNNKQLKNRTISNKKYKRLKKYSYFASLIIFLETMMLILI